MILKILTLLVAFALFPTTVVGRELSSAPVAINLAVSFDLEQKLLTGTAKIRLDPHQDFELLLPDLDITAALLSSPSLENAPIDVTRQELLRLPSAEEPRTLLISYKKKINSSFANIIDNRAIVLTADWHPIPRTKALFSLNARLPEGFIALSQADRFNHVEEDGKVNFHFSQPLYSLTFAAAPYVKKERPVRDDLSVYTLFFKEDQELADAYLEAAVEYIRRYEEQIGPFPYNHYVIAENIMPTGYGFETFTLLGQQVIRLPFITRTSLGHEILHSWFGNSIDISEGSGNWVEGLTTYLADMAYRTDAGEGAEVRKEAIQRYQDYVDETTPPLAQFFGSGHDRRENQAIRAVGYQKSAMLFHELAERIEAQPFARSLQRFYYDFRGKSASWDDLQSYFEEESGQDLQYFFSERLNRTDLPTFEAGAVRVQHDGDSTTVSLTVQQTQSPAYELMLPVTIRTLSGTHQFKNLISEPTVQLSYQVDSTPVEIHLDPQYDLLRSLSSDELKPVWSALLGAENCLIVVPEDNERERYEPFIGLSSSYGCQTIAGGEFSQKDLETHSVIFLGASNRYLRATFGDPAHPATGFTIDVRKNPFNGDLPVALISSSSVEEAEKVVNRLSHYGKYSYLHFDQGRITEKRVPQTDSGISVQVEELPPGLAVANLAEFDELVDQLSKKRVVYVGETHTSRPDHLLQMMLIEALHGRNQDIAIGLEMFPRSSQPALDRFINDPDFSEADFLKESKYYQVWGYDYRLFRPIFSFARKHGIPLVGLNMERDIVSQVFKSGSMDNLSADQQELLPSEMKLDFEGYVEGLAITHNMHSQGNHAEGRLSGFIQAQALWDETMAESVSRFLDSNPATRMVVLAGNQHTRKDYGIPPRVAARIEVSQASVINLATSRASGSELARIADYLFLLDSAEFAPQGKIGIVLQEKESAEGGRVMEIVEVNAQSKAKAAGIQQDDILIFIDKLAIHTMDDVRLALLDKKAGESVRITVLRGGSETGEKVEMEVELYNPAPPPGHP